MVQLHQQPEKTNTTPPRVVPRDMAGSPRVILNQSVTAHSAYDNQFVRRLINYLHAAAGLPVQTTWTKAISKNLYTTWPRLTRQWVEYYLDKSIHTIKGHLGLVQKGIQSTNTTEALLAPDKFTKQPWWTNKRSVTAAVIFVEELRTALGEYGIRKDLVGGFRVCYDEMKEHDMVAQLVKLDKNEVSNLMIKQFKKHHTDYHKSLQIYNPLET
eukprot:jgi/Psemu1/13902/gm1.13902_g